MFNACPHENGEQIKQLYNLAIIRYINFSGDINTCITIRTIVLKDGKDAYIQAGAGIVADSIPEREYQETLNKAKGLLRAIEVAEMI